MSVYEALARAANTAVSFYETQGVTEFPFALLVFQQVSEFVVQPDDELTAFFEA